MNNMKRGKVPSAPKVQVPLAPKVQPKPVEPPIPAPAKKKPSVVKNKK